MITAPIDVITETQAKDIAASKGPTDIWRRCFRVKQYVKDDQRGFGVNPRELAFDQPWQMAAERTGLSWADADRVFLGQLHGCNLKCPYCFVGDDAETVAMTPYEYVDGFSSYNVRFPKHRAGVLRISGGEPMLHQEWVTEILRVVRRGQCNSYPRPPFVWLDTNGTLTPEDHLIDELRRHGRRAGVCICFKPHKWDDGVTLASRGRQYRIARHWVDSNIPIFFYWPSWDGQVWNDGTLLEECLDELSHISPFAPLRLTVIEIKNYKTTDARGWNPDPQELRSQFLSRRNAHKRWCGERYSPDMLWLPSHRVPL